MTNQIPDLLLHQSHVSIVSVGVSGCTSPDSFSSYHNPGGRCAHYLNVLLDFAYK